MAVLPQARAAFARRGAARPIPADARPEGALREQRAARAALSGGNGARALRPGLLLGRGAEVLEDARRGLDVGRVRRGLHAQPDLRGGLLRAHRPRRGGASRLRPDAGRVRGAPARLLGEPRPDPGNAPGQRRGDAVPLGDLHARRGAEGEGRGLARGLPEGPCRRRPRGDHNGGARRPRVLLRRGLPPAVPRQEPGRLLRPRWDRESRARSASPRRPRSDVPTTDARQNPLEAAAGSGYVCRGLGVRG